MTAYLCVASNGVPPSISKRVQLRVQCKRPSFIDGSHCSQLFSLSVVPPMLTIPNQLEGAYQGQNVTLECQTEAYPVSINFWTTDRGDMIISGEWPAFLQLKNARMTEFAEGFVSSFTDTSRAGDKYETLSTSNGYIKHMRLKIRNVGPNDFGSYRCVAKNSLGETDGLIKLDGECQENFFNFGLLFLYW